MAHSSSSARGAACVALITFCALGSPALPADDYRPPRGFNGHLWGESLSAVRGLTFWKASTAHAPEGKLVDFRISCQQNAASGETCGAGQIYREVQGDDSMALAEYYFDKDVNPWAADRIELYIISYLFCARARGEYLPRPIKKVLQLCGTRIMFRSDNLEALAAHGEGYESNYDRILKRLIAEHGEPPGYERQARIIVETDEQRFATPEKAKPHYIRYRWCPPNADLKKLRPACAASVTLTFEATSGEGSIVYATGAVYDFAYALHTLGAENYDLYVLLGERPPDQPYRKEKMRCTGTHICTPQKSAMTARELSEFQP
jgi:hypothetical protein